MLFRSQPPWVVPRAFLGGYFSPAWAGGGIRQVIPVAPPGISQVGRAPPPTSSLSVTPFLPPAPAGVRRRGSQDLSPTGRPRHHAPLTRPRTGTRPRPPSLPFLRLFLANRCFTVVTVNLSIVTPLSVLTDSSHYNSCGSPIHTQDKVPHGIQSIHIRLFWLQSQESKFSYASSP